MKTDLLGIRENQTLNIGLFWTVNDMDWFQDDMAEIERLEKRQRLGERERGIKTERHADGFTLLIIKLH